MAAVAATTPASGGMSAGSSTGRRGSSNRRGSRGSGGAEHNNRYVSVSVRVLNGGAGESYPSGWMLDVWRWLIESYMSNSCWWTPWALGVGLIPISIAIWLIDWIRLYAQLCSLAVPCFALMCGYLLLALGFRHSWTSTGIYLTFCGSVIGETVGFFLSSALLSPSQESVWDGNGHSPNVRQSSEGSEEIPSGRSNIYGELLLHPVYLLGYILSLVAASRLTSNGTSGPSAHIVSSVVLLRSVGCVSLTSLPLLLRPIVTYLSGLVGILLSKFIETSLGMQPEVIPMHPCSQPHLSPAGMTANNNTSRRPSTGEGAADSLRVIASRRRRTSSVALMSTSSTAGPSAGTSSGGAGSSAGQQPSGSSGSQSNHSSGGGTKVRRTSLPALLANKNQSHILPSSAAPWGMDVALLSEAHGLVTDLLLESSTMPPQLVGGLKALSNLLCPPLAALNSSSTSKDRNRHTLPHVALSDVYYASDTEEIPYTGETLLHLSKRGKRFVAPNLLRRMSTSTWTTTTSATGMPTIEPEPSRKRAASFRSGIDGPLPGTASSPSQSQTSLPGMINAELNGSSSPSGSNKSRSHSTTSLYAQQLHPHPSGKRLMRDRKTVCSLHPMSSSGKEECCDLSDSELRAADRPSAENDSENEAQHCSTSGPGSAVDSRRGSGISTRRSSFAGSGGSRRGSQQPVAEDQKSCSGAGSDCEAPDAASAGVVRIADYVTSRSCYNLAPPQPGPSNGGGGGNRHVQRNCDGDENDENMEEQEVLGEVDTDHQRRPHRAAGNKPRTSDYESSDSPNSSDHCDEMSKDDQQAVHLKNDLNNGPNGDDQVCPLLVTFDENHQDPSIIVHQVEEMMKSGRLVSLEDGSRYDLDQLEKDRLLEDLKEWDYPIFDLLDRYEDRILSATCYRVFLEVGLFEAFKIPIREFFHFFHALELGYREKPYHNRTHASDVLHAVYYLTSQPIPGFTVLPFDTDPTSTKTPGMEAASPALTQRASFNFEDSYGIMGANFPALELMALYTAATMHDYDHPGRTNAFLVSTLAPQAILYNDRSVLENHHAASAWSLFLSDPRFNFLVHLEKAEFKRFRYLIIEAILATDLKRHFEILAEFNAKVNDVDAPGIDWTNETDRMLAMQMCIKLADINGPCKVHKIHVSWTHRIAEEFYEQGDEEAALGMPISPYMDRKNPQLAKLQESFINHLVAPLCNAYGEAGLLPGEWDDSIDEDDENDSLRSSSGSSGSDERHDNSSGTEDSESLADLDAEMRNSEGSNGSDGSRTPVHSKRSPTGRKIICLQTQHLQENHRYWVAKIKESELRPQADSTNSGPGGESNSRCSSPVSIPEDRMEPIEEENSPKSFDRSFSFEKEEDSKL